MEAIPLDGGCTFAEDPAIPARDATIIWTTGIDPATLTVRAEAGATGNPDCVDPAGLSAWLRVATDRHGVEHAVLSDGFHHIRLDCDCGSLAAGPVFLRYLLCGIADVPPRLTSLRRFIDLVTRRRFSKSLYPRDPRLDRFILLLRVSDALRAGASKREIAGFLVGRERVEREWRGQSDALRSRVRRLVRDAELMSSGGYRRLLNDQSHRVRPDRSPTD